MHAASQLPGRAPTDVDDTPDLHVGLNADDEGKNFQPKIIKAK